MSEFANLDKEELLVIERLKKMASVGEREVIEKLLKAVSKFYAMTNGFSELISLNCYEKN